MESINDKKILIADIGHWQTKSSFSGDEIPRTLIHSLVGDPRFPQFIRSSETSVVDPPADISDMYYIKSILENGKITDEALFKDFFSFLQNENKSLKSQDFGLFLSEPLFLDDKQKSLIAKIVFEEHRNPFIGFYPQPLMALFSKGVSNGLILEMGHGMTQIAGVQNGFRISETFQRQDIGGGAMNDFFKRILNSRGSSIDRDFIDNIVDFNGLKEQVVDCGLKPEVGRLGEWDSRRMRFSNADLRKKKRLELPDGSVTEIDDLDSVLGELIFDPSMADLPFKGVHDLLYESFQTMDVSLRKVMRDNIYISGGLSQMTNLSERLALEMNQKMADGEKGYVFGNTRNFAEANEGGQKENLSYFDIKSVGHPTHSVFIGGTIICNTASSSLFITSKDFEEMGEHGIFRKFY